MPTELQTIADAIQIVRAASYPQGFSEDSAWLGIYRALLWYEPVNVLGFTNLPHIIDANNLRPTASQKPLVKPNAWQLRAQAFEQYLAAHLDCAASDVEGYVDRLLRLPAYLGLQRQNSLGIAFPGLIKFILETFGNNTVSYDLEVEWSVRHDRINDITNECPIYKAAAMRSRIPLAYYVVTNEFSPARLSKMLGDICINNLIHVHKNAVTTACNLNGRLAGMLDLADLIRITTAW